MSARITSFVVVLSLWLSAQASAQEPAPVEGPSSSPAPDATPQPPAADTPAAPSAPSAPNAEVPAPPPEPAALEAQTVYAPADQGSDTQVMSAEELAGLGLGTEESSVDLDIHLSGFADFGMQIGLNNLSKAVTDEYPSFAVGNINLYLTKNLSESVRTMIEVRVLYLPNTVTSSPPGSTIPPVSTQVADYSDFGRPLRWGGVEVERIYVDWAAFSFLSIRAGQFLTPYGVWNVDHGSPTVIPAAKPYVIGAGFFPERQTGLELHGRMDAGSVSVIGYHLTFSNGTGPVTEYKDLDANKAVGARAYWEYRAVGELRLGASAYYGRDTQGTSAIAVGEGGSFKTDIDIASQSNSLALAFDAVWKFQQLHLQTEWLCLQREYTEAGRALTVSFAGSPIFPADGISWGMYGLAGYRFEWFGVMPFVAYQRMFQPEALDIYGFHFGINVRPIDALTLKVQFDFVRPSPDSADKIKMIYLQAAWAF